MPIRKSERRRYPVNWPAISDRIRLQRAQGRCECLGECGLHRTTGRCTEVHGQRAKWAKGFIVLTVAHLNHTPEDVRDSNLRAYCQKCHLRYDMELHQRNSAETRRWKGGQ